jgi:hypothetical protein
VHDLFQIAFNLKDQRLDKYVRWSWRFKLDGEGFDEQNIFLIRLWILSEVSLNFINLWVYNYGYASYLKQSFCFFSRRLQGLCFEKYWQNLSIRNRSHSSNKWFIPRAEEMKEWEYKEQEGLFNMTGSWVNALCREV